MAEEDKGAKWRNPYTIDDDGHLFVHYALREHNTGSIHFGPDPRFISSMDQTRWCFVLFNNWVRCVEKLGEDAERCKYLHHKFRAVTPVAIQDKWTEELEEGRFPGYCPNDVIPEVVIDYSLKPSRTRHLEHHHDEEHH